MFTVRLSMSSFMGREAVSAGADFSSAEAFGSVAAVVGTELAGGSGRPMSSQLPWPFSSRLRARFRPSTRTSLICTSRRSSGSTRTDRPSICKSANGTLGLFSVAILASCSSRPSQGNRLQPISPLRVSSR
ncbi:hypothetical protein D9M71_740590 [compost metagenome]